VNRATRSDEALLGILNEFKNWGEKDILLAAIDGLTGFPDAIAVYTTNAIESINYTTQKIIKHRYSFSNDEAVMKFKNICNRLTIPIRD
jgi:transposase-like protein